MSEHLWAPWRMRYLENTEKPDGCIFCDFPERNDDEKHFILHRGNHAFVILNAYPYTNGHLMVAPFRHISKLSELNDAELLEINQLVVQCSQWIDAVYHANGFNIGVNVGAAAGAGIPGHVHWHIVPRWTGDTNFMTTIGEMRVLPQTLEQSYAALNKQVEK